MALLLLKVTVLLLGALVAGYLWRRSPRRVHQMWTVVFATIIALPVLTGALPALNLPVTSTWVRENPVEPLTRTLQNASATTTVVDPGGAAGSDASETAAAPGPASASVVPDESTARTTPDWPSVATAALWIWIAGTGVAVTLIIVSLCRARLLARSATDIDDRLWQDQAAAISREFGFPRKVRLLVSDRIHTPMAGEVWRPTIFLPADARWDAVSRRAVIGHEIAHLAAHDPLRHLATRLMLALYWFHPLAWLAARLDARACEDACDESVVSTLALRPSAYALVLLDVADSARPSAITMVALPMAQPSSLERRLRRILSSTTRSSATRVPVPAIACGVLALLVASTQPVAQTRQPAASPTVTEPRVDPPADLPPAPPPDAMQLIGTRTGAASAAESGCSSPLMGRPGGEGARARSAGARDVAMVVTERVDAVGFTRSIQRTFGDLRVCLLVEGVTAPAIESPSTMVAEAARIVLEADYLATRQRLAIAKTPAGVDTAFRMNGIGRSVDADVDRWRRQVLGILDTSWELSTLRDDQRDRRAELDTRRQTELTELLQLVRAMGRQAVAASPAGPEPSACDLTSADFGPAERRAGPAAGRPRPRYLREAFGELQLCVRIDEGNVFETIRPSELMRTARFAVLEARRSTDVHQWVITRDEAGAARDEWRVNGVVRSIDEGARRWRDRIVAVLDTSWEIWALRGQEGLLNGRIGEIQGQVATDEIRPGDADSEIAAIRTRLDALNVEDRIAAWTARRQDQVQQFRAAMEAVR